MRTAILVRLHLSLIGSTHAPEAMIIADQLDTPRARDTRGSGNEEPGPCYFFYINQKDTQ